MMILNSLNSQTGFHIKSGGSREAVVSAGKGFIDLCCLCCFSALFLICTHTGAIQLQQLIPEWHKLYDERVSVCA